MGVDSLTQAGPVAVFLDRDGTLNRAFWRDGISVPPQRLDQVELLPGVQAGLRELKLAGFALIVVSNQPDVARGTQSQATVDAINAYLCAELDLDEVLCCFHDDSDRCLCRKPAPGLLIDAATRHGLHLPGCYLVGDRWSDVEAGRRAGCSTILLGVADDRQDHASADFVVSDFHEATRLILQRREEGLRETIC